MGGAKYSLFTWGDLQKIIEREWTKGGVDPFELTKEQLAASSFNSTSCKSSTVATLSLLRLKFLFLSLLRVERLMFQLCTSLMNATISIHGRYADIGILT